MENPLAVGQVGKNDGQELSHDRRWHDVPLEDAVAEPVGEDVDQGGHDAPEDIGDDILVLAP